VFPANVKDTINDT